MAIQGTQVPMYKNTHCFCIFSIFFNFFYMKNKIKQNWKVKQTKTCLNKAMHKTRLTQNTKVKHTSNAKTKTRRVEREKVTESLGAPFLPHLGRTFSFSKPLIWQWGGRIKTVQVRKEHEGFGKISKGSKGGWKLILVSRAIMLLLCWVVNHL